MRNRHARGETSAGINVRKGAISDILEENVVQPLLVSVSALTLATETVRSILKIDDIVSDFILVICDLIICFFLFVSGEHYELNNDFSASVNLLSSLCRPFHLCNTLLTCRFLKPICVYFF